MSIYKGILQQIAPPLIELFRGVLHDANADNFVTATIEDVETDEKYEFTIRRADGQTPAEKINELKAKLKELEVAE